MRADGIKGHLDLVLLGALATAPGHGYAVIGAIRARSGGVLDLPEGSVYPALHRLEDLGLVMSEWVPVSGRRRREYHLTAAGERALGVERNEWSRLARAIDAVAVPRPSRPGNALAGGLA
jgi:DNA-binding PadR family transcriptional regulator